MRWTHQDASLSYIEECRKYFIFDVGFLGVKDRFLVEFSHLAKRELLGRVSTLQEAKHKCEIHQLGEDL